MKRENLYDILSKLIVSCYRSIMKFYKELLMDHFKNPRYRGRLENPDFSTAQYNPSCGDSISIQGCVEKGILTKVAFIGSGCVISQAAASILSELCIDKPIDEILAIKKEDVPKLLGIDDLGPTRLKCALLALVALQDGLLKYKKRMEESA